MEDKAAATTILLVDDDQDQLTILRLHLQSRGYQVVLAESARNALSILRERPLDLVICDVRMPEMSGLELCARVKDDSSLADVPFVLLTASFDALQVEAGTSRADSLCVKQNLKGLLTEIERLVGTGR